MKQLHIGGTIRDLRKSKGVTQEQLAELLNISTPAVSKWESGQTNPDIAILPILARYFGVSIDHLLGFTREPNAEEIEAISTEIAQAFADLPFAEARQVWSDYLRQYPTCYPLMYELATIAIFQMIRIADAEEEAKDFSRQIAQVFEQCTKSDELHIKQGAYFQMANMYIVLEEFDKAQAILDQIPAQEADPKFLQSTLYLRKGEHKQAVKLLKENLLRSMGEMIANLGTLIAAYRDMGGIDTDVILDVHEKRQAIAALFGMEVYSVGMGLEIAHLLAERKEHGRFKLELEEVIRLFETYPQGLSVYADKSFFQGVELLEQALDSPISTSAKGFLSDALRGLVEQIFSFVEEDTDLQELRERLEDVLP